MIPAKKTKTMICKKCGQDLPDEASFCWRCGKPTVKHQSTKKRGNGQGSVFQLPNGKYKAVVVTGYYLTEDGKKRKHTRSKVFEKKKDAVAALATLKDGPKKSARKSVTFKAVYDAWLPTHRAGKDTVNCYKAAIKYFEPVYSTSIAEIDLDDLQECIDDCPHGKRTKQNMKAVCGLVYKYAIPRKMIPDNLNLAQFLIVSGESAARRESFNDIQIEKIRKACGTVPHADEVYCMIYTGFRPSEFLALTAADYDSQADRLTGGSKTDAGRGRSVTISPKIKSNLARLVASGGYLCHTEDGKQWDLKSWTDNVFYPVLEAAGIDNPLVEIAGGKTRHKYTPHSCRHTFATLMKRVSGADKDKQALIGHASSEMLRYYQDETLEDLRRITDAI